MIRIVEIGEIVWPGKTEPMICRAEDGNEYVVKRSFAHPAALPHQRSFNEEKTCLY